MPEINPTHPEWGLYYKPREIALLCSNAGWTSAQKLLEAVSVCIAESNGYSKRKHENLDSNGNLLSTDRGIWMINDKSHPGVTDVVAYDAVKATKVAFDIYKGRDYTFRAWAAYTNGRYKEPKAMGYAFDGIANHLRLKNGYPV